MLFEMANLHKEETGLPYNIWLDSQGIDRQTKHNLPRLKVDVDGDKIPEISVSIDTQNPQALQNEYQGFRFEKEIFDWIIKNYEVLIAHWDHKITDRKALILLGHDEIQDISAKGEGAM